MIWHRNACGSVDFNTYVGVANPSVFDPIQTVLDLPEELEYSHIVLEGREVQLPHTIEIPKASWRHMHVEPPRNVGRSCREPELFDLYVDILGKAAISGSVVDRSTQDPRTVEGIPREGGIVLGQLDIQSDFRQTRAMIAIAANLNINANSNRSHRRGCD